MKRNKSNKIFGALLPILTMALLVSCTDVESIDINRPGLEEQSPELMQIFGELEYI